MLHTNLATRPFYNERAVRVGLVLAVLGIAALTVFNVLQILGLNARTNEMTQRAQDAERQTAEYRQQAQAIRQSLNTQEMTAIQEAAREANLLIDRRVFSWTDLFNEFERTLPADVRIAAVIPQVDDKGQLLLAVTAISRSPEDLNAFMDQLEASGRFRDMLNRQDEVLEDGLTRSVVQGYYEPGAAVPTSAAPDASDSGDRRDTASPGQTPSGPSPAPEGAR